MKIKIDIEIENESRNCTISHSPYSLSLSCLPFYKFKLFFLVIFVKYLIGVVIYEFQGEVGRSAKGAFTLVEGTRGSQ